MNHAPASVTPEQIERTIAIEFYLTGAEAHQAAALRDGLAGFANQREQQNLSLLTMCLLVLHNGFTVVGTSACADPAKFDAEIGRKLARAKAIEQVWPLLGYELKTNLRRAAAMGASS